VQAKRIRNCSCKVPGHCHGTVNCKNQQRGSTCPSVTVQEVNREAQLAPPSLYKKSYSFMQFWVDFPRILNISCSPWVYRTQTFHA